MNFFRVIIKKHDMIHTSKFWIDHFENNLKKKRIDWDESPHFTEENRRLLLPSLKAWQLGETSDGSHLLAASTKYANKINDPDYIEAVKLFIKEEQKHGANLGRYIDLIGEERAKKNWGDTLFRKIRYFNKSMELWTITVVIVESAAQLFYQALADGSECKLLKSICSDILIDEAHHIKFQNERLHILFQKKSTYAKTFATLWYSGLFFGVIHAIWFAHGRAFKAGGVSRSKFMQQMHYKYFSTLRFLFKHEALEEYTPVMA